LMTIDADTVAAAVAETWQHLTDGALLPGSWTLREGGAFAAVTGVALPTLNGVWGERIDPDPGAVAGLLDRVKATGLPYCLQLRPGMSPALTELAESRGMVADVERPLMLLEEPAAIAHAPEASGLRLRQLSPEEASLHVGVAAAGFGAPEEPFLRLMTPDVLRLPGVRCYVGDVGGQPVTTGLGVTLGAFTAVFTIATLPACRGRGYGSAMTARIVADGLAAGAKWSWLQSSPAGYPVYDRLGFRTVESWPCWLSAAGENLFLSSRVGEDSVRPVRGRAGGPARPARHWRATAPARAAASRPPPVRRMR
jgi:GNAT superfamily N-acetyltransferase